MRSTILRQAAAERMNGSQQMGENLISIGLQETVRIVISQVAVYGDFRPLERPLDETVLEVEAGAQRQGRPQDSFPQATQIT
ncbi:MAG: hypothetical protein P8Y94_10620 [Acidobacteriota bacterium]